MRAAKGRGSSDCCLGPPEAELVRAEPEATPWVAAKAAEAILRMLASALARALVAEEVVRLTEAAGKFDTAATKADYSKWPA